MPFRIRRCTALLLLAILLAQPLAAEQSGMVVKGEIFFAGRQGRWTLLVALTVLLGTEENYGLAMDAADKAFHIAESSGDDARAATALRYKAVLFEEQGKFAEAESAVAQAQALREKSVGAEDPAVADLLVTLARLQRQQNKLEGVAALLARAEKIRVKAFGEPTAAVADVILERAMLLRSQKHYPESEPLFREAMRIKEKALGPEDPDLAEVLRCFAESLVESGRANEAEPLYLRALDIQQKFLGSDDPIALPTLTNLAALYEKLGRAQEAVKYKETAARLQAAALAPFNGADQQKEWTNLVGRSFAMFNSSEFSSETQIAQTAVRFSEAKFGPDDFRVAAFLMLLAHEYSEGQAAFSTAERLMRHAVRVQEKTLGTEDASLAETLLFYSGLLQREHKDREAEAVVFRSMKIQERAMNTRVTEDPFMHSPRLSLSSMYVQQGRFSEAEKLFQEAIEAQEKTRGPEPPRDFAMAGLTSGLAGVFRAEGKPEQAVPLLEQAITYNEKAWGIGWGGYKKVMVARGLNDLANAYVQQRQYGEAESTYERAGKMRGFVADGDATQMRWNLAYAYQLDGKNRKAEELLQRELKFDEQNNLTWHIDTTLKKIAGLYISEDRYADAEPLLERSLKMEESTMQAESPFLANTLYDLGTANFALGQSEKAQMFFARSFAILSHELQYYFSYMSEADRLGVLSTVEYRYPIYFSFVERFSSSNPQLAAGMYDLLLWQKGLVVRSIESLRRKVAASGDAETLALLEDLAARRTQLSGLVNSGGLSELARKKLESLKSQADEIEQKLAARSQSFAEQQKQQAADWKAIRGTLAAKQADAAVEFVRYPFYDGKKWTESMHYAAMVISAKSVTPQFVYLGEAAALEAQPLTEYKSWVARPERKAASPAPLAASHALYDAFWKPLLSALGSAKQVYVSPDGVLNQVSLAVVPTGDGRLLSDAYDLRILNGTADLLRSSAVAPENTAVLIGNPKFPLTVDEQQQEVAALDKPQAGAQTVLVAALQRGETLNGETPTGKRGVHRSGVADEDCTANAEVLPQLPGTEKEVQNIYALLQDQQWSLQTPFIGSRALEEVVKRVHHPRVLHIATHGFFQDNQATHPAGSQITASDDPMLRSGLYLAGATRSVCGASTNESVDDGVLTAYEASLLDLQGTELVVLSACETGLGSSRAGEGVFGLRRAFQEAGSSSVLISMWQVPDEETTQLMSLFYKHWLAGNDKHRALWLAQQELRKDLQSRNADYPYYWGAFVLVGD